MKSAFVLVGSVLLVGALAAQSRYNVPRTPWGDPDLQGLWPSNDMQGTPYERPENFGTRAQLNDEELKARQSATQRQAETDAETTFKQGERVGIGAPANWGERGRPTRQASLIVDPPDGRFPPMTADGERRSKEAYST
ncbi:MAG TPA: hypothetical protein VN628_17750, partial [Vicinamibacterales bacterium]|nr:hypothetical protein [Vicinamibacterales bacterium]